MTLIITEVSNLGIVMVADSAISKLDPKTGRILGVITKGWNKIIRVPSIKAAISYWGTIGAVTRKQFDLWLKETVINSGNYEDLESFVDHLVNELNKACNGRILEESVGIHIAGYAPWVDGQIRPVFFHVHNGHGYIATTHEIDSAGKIIALHNQWIRITKTNFEKHLDFPNPQNTLRINLEQLEEGYHTRNGDFAVYAKIWEALAVAFHNINLIQDFSIPANPNNLGSRKDFWQMMVETVIRVYSCSNHKQKPSIGGKAASLAISPSGYLPPIDDGIG